MRKTPYWRPRIYFSLLTVFLFASLAGGGERSTFTTGSETPSRLAQLARLTASDGRPNDQLGWSVAVNGNTLVVGAPFAENNGQGMAYVFVKPAAGWKDMVQTARLTASDGSQGGSFFGYGVAIEGDIVVVGALNLAPLGASRTIGQPQSSPAPGAYVFVKPKSGWRDMTETAKLSASDAQVYDYFASSVSISGNTIIVGTPQTGVTQATGPGKAYVYVKPPRGWKSMTETARLTASDGVLNDLGGQSVSNSGNTVVFGAPNHSPRGAVYVFVKPASGWKNMTQTAELKMAEKLASSAFGYAVSISGNTLVSGAWGVKFHNDVVGAAFVFEESAAGWKNMTETAKLTIPHIPFTFDLGYSVAINRSRVALGAPSFPWGTGPGSAYLFVKPVSGWKTTSKFDAQMVPSDSGLGDRFGSSVALSDATVLVGATVAGGLNSSAGAAYVFGK